jgi:hypothetical protein
MQNVPDSAAVILEALKADQPLTSTHCCDSLAK